MVCEKHISSIYSTPEWVLFAIFAYIAAAGMRWGLVKQWASLERVLLRFITRPTTFNIMGRGSAPDHDQLLQGSGHYVWDSFWRGSHSHAILGTGLYFQC